MRYVYFAVVVFIQDDETRETYQSAIAERSVDDFNLITSLEDEFLKTQKLWLFPNPANEQVYFGFEKTVNKDYAWQLTDLSAKTIKIGTLERGKYGVELNTSDLAEGLYLIQLKNKQEERIVKKLLIKH